MKTTLAALAALSFAGLSFGAAAGPATTRPVLAPANPHLGMHLVCKDDVHNHRQVKVCIWVKNG